MDTFMDPCVATGHENHAHGKCCNRSLLNAHVASFPSKALAQLTKILIQSCSRLLGSFLDQAMHFVSQHLFVCATVTCIHGLFH